MNNWDDINYPDKVPFRIADEEEQYLRIKYSFLPEVIAKQTVQRTVIHNTDDPKVGYIDHELNTGGKVRFKGFWTESNDSNQSTVDCVLLFHDNEVICVPVTSALIQLRKETA